MSLPRPVQNDGIGYNTPDVQRQNDILAHADDRVYEAMFTPGALLKTITPLVEETQTVNPRLLVIPSATAGKVALQPCLLVAGTAAATVALSALLQALLDAPTQHAANASGNPRIDLVYATVSRSAPAVITPPAGTQYTGRGPEQLGTGPLQGRRIKDVNSGQVTTQNVNIYDLPTITISVLAGTPAGSPVAPALPADTATAFNFALSNVAIANGYTLGTAITQANITPVWTAGGIPLQRVRHSTMLIPAGAAQQPSTTIATARRGFGQAFEMVFKYAAAFDQAKFRLGIDVSYRWVRISMVKPLDTFDPIASSQLTPNQGGSVFFFTGKQSGGAGNQSGVVTIDSKGFKFTFGDGNSDTLVIEAQSAPVNATDHWIVLAEFGDRFVVV